MTDQEIRKFLDDHNPNMEPPEIYDEMEAQATDPKLKAECRSHYRRAYHAEEVRLDMSFGDYD